MDLTESIIPKSDQINYEDIANGATATYTIRTVTKGNVEQPFNFMLVETDKAYRPSKTMRKVIVAAWGPDATAYAGRRLTLYGEPSIMFGGKKVGGLRIRAMSHIDGPLEVMAQTTRGKREAFTVQPLQTASPPAPGSAPTGTDSGPRTPAATTPSASQPEASPSGGREAAAGEGPSLADQLRAMTEDDRAELRRRIPIADGAKASEVASLLGDYAADLAGLLEQLRARDCTFAKLAEDNAAAARFEHQVVTDTLPPSESQERLEAGNPEVGAPIPMYGDGAPA